MTTYGFPYSSHEEKPNNSSHTNEELSMELGEFDKMHRAKWVDGYINGWSNYNQDWIRSKQNMSVVLKILNNPANVTSEFINKNITVSHRIYGISQDPETKNYIVVWNEICEKYTQLSVHDNDNNIEEALELIPYNRLYNIKNIAVGEFDKMYRAKWVDGCISGWSNYDQDWIRSKQNMNMSVVLKILSNPANNVTSKFINKNITVITIDKFDKVCRAKWIDGYILNWDIYGQNWERFEQNMSVFMKILINPAKITSEFANKTFIKVPHKVYGITQDPETKNYMVVWNEICRKCNYICNAIRFKQNFENWSSDSNGIDKIIQNAQLSVHSMYNVFVEALEWIPYNRIYDIEHITKGGFDKMYRAKWIDGYLYRWDNCNHKWERKHQNMVIILKIFNNPTNIMLEFMEKPSLHLEVFGITQDPKTKNYIMVLNDKCEKCNRICRAKYFQQNFKNWSSGNNDIDEFIQETQLSNCYANNALEWIPFDRFYDIKYIAKGGLNNSKNVTLKFMNEITLHYKVNLDSRCIIKLYGITQDPETKDYIMVLDYAENGNLRNYLDANYNELNWNNKINYLHSIAHGLKDIHEKELIHRDLHIEKIKRLLSQWFRESSELKNHNVYTELTELQKQIIESEKSNNNLSISNEFSVNLGASYETHSEAIYISRLLNLSNLPVPKNSYDYYEENDNIISMESSVSLSLQKLQIDIS
ncbi:kinase-like domain-containing protein [Rhizophagus irregularis DAOM 181602=DAOM 197198]|nr:kinase-like domain-containing protein [Rhizophagus irregularis DAOM 181602=DAOM 197198]